MQLCIVYAPDTKASGRLLLYSDKNAVKAYDAEAREEHVKTLIEELAADSVQGLTADGAFTYIAAGDSIYRYNTVDACCTHKLQLPGKATVDRMLTARNLLLVVSHTPAGDYHLDMFYKTDLEAIKTFSLSKPAADMAVTGDKLYVLTSADGKSGMDIFDLKNFIQERQVSLGQKGLGVETLVARDARVYGIRPYNPTTEEAAAILEFNTTNRTSKLIGTDGIQAYFEGVPAAVKPMDGDSILLANYNGFTAYDTETGKIRDGIIMTAGNTVYPTEAVQDTLSQRTYVVYADENAETYQGAVYYGDEFTKEFDIYDLGRTPAYQNSQTTRHRNRPAVSA